MPRTKLKRLLKLDELPNIFNIKNAQIKESLKSYFRNDKLFTLEIGCGHGEYSVELAQKFSDKNFIGIDVKGARIYNGAIEALDKNLSNVAFIVTKAERMNEIFEQNSIEEIYIPFPEPHVKRSKQNRRLISPLLLNIYRKLLSDSGLVHFKTDNQDLYEYAAKNILISEGKILHTTDDLHNNYDLKFRQDVITNFERHYIDEGRKIKYICFRF